MKTEEKEREQKERGGGVVERGEWIRLQQIPGEGRRG